MKTLTAVILLFVLYINLTAGTSGKFSCLNNNDSSQVESATHDKQSSGKSTGNKFISDFQLNAFYITNKYEYLEIQFNIVPMFNKYLIIQIGTTFGTGETDKTSISSQNIEYTVSSYLFGLGGLIHFKNQEFMLLFNYAEKDYVINLESGSKFNRSADYFALYDNIGIGKFRFLAGVKYFIKNIPVQGKEEKWAASIGFGFKF